MKKYKDEEWLQKKYIDEGMTMAEIAEISGCNDSTIHYWLHNHGINPRDAVVRSHHVNLTPYGQKFLDGLMLGDGGMENSAKSGYYYHGDSYREYIRWLSEKLSQIGLENKIGPDGHRVWTKSYQELKSQYDQWYPTGHKKTRIPDRVEITPVILFNWFIGDGTYHQDKRGTWHLKIGSTGFKEGFSRIINQIKGLRISCTRIKNGINIRKESHQDFFDYILSSGIKILPGYERKFPDKKIIGGTN